MIRMNAVDPQSVDPVRDPFGGLFMLRVSELETYTEGRSRRITVKSINDYIDRRLAAEAVRRGRAASHGNDQSRP